MTAIRIGMMGLGRVGRQIYGLAQEDPRFQMVAISDIGRPDILHHLLTKTVGHDRVALEGNYLVSDRDRTRLLSADRPAEVPWDVFGVDVVIDATGRYRTMEQLVPHLDNGARRVVLSVLPEDELDRVVLYGVNEQTADAADRIVSAGSASTSAAALALKTLMDAFAVEHATVTSVHEYTSDQSLQDYAGPDYRRSRSGAENIIPNDMPARVWVPRLLPELAGKLSACALNVPVQVGSLLDLTVAFREPEVDADAVKASFQAAATARPGLLTTTSDPIVSSDVRGLRQSLLVDLGATLKAGARLVKVLGWHETLGHAGRILDVAALYAGLDAQRTREVS